MNVCMDGGMHGREQMKEYIESIGFVGWVDSTRCESSGRGLSARNRFWWLVGWLVAVGVGSVR